MMPSSAMLITPPRSENIPPSDASVSGVAYLTIDARSDRLMMVRSILVSGFLNRSSNESLRAAAKHCFTGNEQNNDRLKDHHPILRHIVGEDVYEQPRPDQRSKQNRGQQHARGVIPAQQRYRDSGEAVVRREVVIVPIAIPEHVVYPNHSRKHPRDEHRNHNVAADRDAAVFRSRRADADCAQLIAPLRLPQENINDYACGKRQQKSHVQRQAIGKSYSKWSQQRAHSGDVRSDNCSVYFLSYRQRLEYRVALFAIVILSQIADQTGRNEVHHYRGDHFVSAELCL